MDFNQFISCLNLKWVCNDFRSQDMYDSRTCLSDRLDMAWSPPLLESVEDDPD